MGVVNATTGTYRFRQASTPFTSVRVFVYSASAWVGTVSLQTSDPDQNVFITDSTTAKTANAAYAFTPGGDCDIRLTCTAYTSGIPIGAIVGLA